MLKVSFKIFFLLLGIVVFTNSTFAGGTKTITRGQTAIINWNVTGAPNCSPDTNYPSNAGDNVKSLWLGAGGSTSGSVTFPTVYSVSTSGWTFTCTDLASGISDSATLIVNDCPTGTTWNGSACTAPPTGDIKANGLDSGATCTIPAGSATCSGTISWSTVNATNASVWIGTANPGVGTTGSFTVGWLGYGANTFNLHNGTTQSGALLDSVTITGTCPGTAPWNGSTCGTTSKPDLVVSGITPTSVTAGTNVTLSTTVTNQGNLATPSVTNATLFEWSASSGGSGAQPLNTHTITGSLAVGASYPATISFSAPAPGTYYVRACTDNNGVVDESNEGNNCGSIWTPITVSCPSPNTYWNGTSCTTPPVGACNAQSMTWLTSCSGTTSSASNGGTSVVTNTASGYTGSATYTCSSGTWTGPTNASCAPSACANGATNPPTCTTCSPGFVLSGGQCVAQCTDSAASNYLGPEPCVYGPTVSVRADSPINTLPSSTTTFTFTSSVDDGHNTACRPLNSSQGTISGYGYVTGTTSVTLKAANIPSVEGEYTYYIRCRDISHTSASSTDNIKLYVCPAGKVWSSRSKMCVLPSDLTAGPVLPTSATVDVQVALSSLITNQGGGSTEQSFDNFFQMATQPNGGGTIINLNNDSVNTLAAGASGTTTINYTFSTAGTFYLRACADKRNATDDGKINESDENNNCGDWTPVVVSDGSCPLPWGGTIRNGRSVDAYDTSSVFDPDKCDNHRERRTCTNSVLSGSYTYQNCNVAPPPGPSISFNITPRTVAQNGLIKLSWSIQNPTAQCSLSAVVQRPPSCNASCEAARSAAEDSINNMLTNPSYTNANDPNGSRLMNTALRTAVSGVTARGEKSLNLQYSTTFTLSCGGTSVPVKTIIYVTENNEG